LIEACAPRVAVALPYASYWESAVPFDFRAERERLLGVAAARLGSSATIVERAVVASREDGAAFAEAAAAAGTEVLLVVQTMAAMPAFALTAVELLPDLPVVVWALHQQERLSEDFDHAAITAGGATVGTPMLTNMLVRSDRRFELVVGWLGDSISLEALATALRAGATSVRLRRARIGRVGEPIEGYDCVDADADRLRRVTGIELVPTPAAEVRDLFLAVVHERIAELERETRALYDVRSDAEGDVLSRSIRAACALEDLVRRHGLDAGALNCHVPEIRFSDEVGIAPCFALGRLTSRGIPWACAGDVLTPVAMLALRLLGGAAQYHELESLDHLTGEFVVASSGEFDLAFGDGSRPALLRNRWFERDPRCGACASFGAPAGPATLVGFTELDAAPGYRFVVAEGEFTGRAFPNVGTPWAAFRFANGPAVEAWTRWCRAGANHHSAATPGHYGAAIETVARFLGVEALRV
jgi:L-fucose isomerase-like protein